ncbi:MAG TPA: hypothetical protein VK191_16740, partial [Symbiobacteriaceae bacterium]|nr:hypothetical protein [Symbiobacteriaceae bacterium]
LPLTAVAGTALVWLAGWVSPMLVDYTPLWPMDSWPLALGAAVVGLALAGVVARWLAGPLQEKGPLVKAA